MKKVRFLILGLIVSLLTVTPTFAANTEPTTVELNSTVARAEEVQWKYRTYNGKRQKRCWSVTYQKWKTDWINA